VRHANDVGQRHLEMRGGFVTRGVQRCLTVLLSGALLLASGGRALAQSVAPADDASSGNIAKGTVGGAMIGAEVVMLAESAFRLRPMWLYLVGGGAGGLAGGYLGYHLSDGGSNEPPSFLLAGGIALIIPTIMGVLTATQYAPPSTFRPDSPEDEAEDASEARAPLRLGPPRVGLAQAFSREELARFRVQQATELHLSLLRGEF
jgi:hypothetical protein